MNPHKALTCDFIARQGQNRPGKYGHIRAKKCPRSDTNTTHMPICPFCRFDFARFTVSGTDRVQGVTVRSDFTARSPQRCPSVSSDTERSWMIRIEQAIQVGTRRERIKAECLAREGLLTAASIESEHFARVWQCAPPTTVG